MWPFEQVMGWVVAGLKGIAAGTLLFGVWSALRPSQSVALYQAIMRGFNWRVEPIDRSRELRATRWLGVALACCSILSFLLLLK